MRNDTNLRDFYWALVNNKNTTSPLLPRSFMFGEGGVCDLNWRMVLFVNNLCTRAMSVAGERQIERR